MLTLAALLSIPLVAGVPAADPLAAARKRVEPLAVGLAKDGQREAALLCLSEYAELGATEKQHERLEERIHEALERAKGKPPKASALAKHAKAATRIADMLSDVAGSLEADGARAARARALRFDPQCDALREAMGDVRGGDGVWRDEDGARCHERRTEVAAAIQAARRLEIEIELFEAQDPTLVAWAAKEGLPTSGGRAGDLVFEGTVEPDRLAETLRATVRALAFSNWLVRGVLEPVHLPIHQIQLTSRYEYKDLADAFLSDGRITEREHELGLKLAGFYPVGGPRGAGPVGAQMLVVHDSQLQLVSGTVLMYGNALGTGGHRSGDLAPPVWLQTGHANYVAHSVLGVGIPDLAVVERPEGRSGSIPAREEIKLPRSGLVGSRSWLRELVKEGRDPGLASCMLDAHGKLTGPLLVKATCVTEYLHERGDLPAVLDTYRKLTSGDDPGLPAERWERAALASLPEFEEGWRAWLFGGDPRSVAGLLQSAGSSPAGGGEAADVLARLNRLRKEAKLEVVSLDESLSKGAALHAAYLKRNKKQQSRWPDVFEERPEAAGFTPEGAWAGAHSVVGFAGAADCLDEWMGTLWHRLPLVHPGLLRVGFGSEGKISVLDAGSVVDPSGYFIGPWPYDGMEGVPLRFATGLPTPVPEGASPRSLGYPITLQLGNWHENPKVKMKLLKTGEAEPVPCWFSAPYAPATPALALDGVYALVPRDPLEPNTRYHVEAILPDRVVGFSFLTGK